MAARSVGRNPLMIMMALLALVACAPSDSPDLREYLDSVRRAGMTESARGALETVAEIRIGQVTLTFPKDPESGLYGSTYRSNTCPNPNSPPAEQQAFQQRAEAEAATEVGKLKPFADADSSGFITTGEAEHFRQMYEFGLKAQEVIKQEGADPERVAKGLGITRDKLVAEAAEYRSLAEKLKDLHGPKIPQITL